MQENTETTVSALTSHESSLHQEEFFDLTCEDMRSLYTTWEAKKIQATASLREDIERWIAVKKLLQEEKAIKTRIMNFMRECDTLVDGKEILVTWKGRGRKALNTKYLQTHYPDVYKACRKYRTDRYLVLHSKRKKD